VARSGARLADAQVHMGAEDSVGLVLAEDLDLLIPALAFDGVSAEVVYIGPLSAPIAKGQEVAKLVIKRPEMEILEVPLYAEADVVQAGFLKRLAFAATNLRSDYLSEF
jgi:D-alanyl-D-alanine carboxypeptidase (penicillin-binding protein 5/6)